MITCPGIQRLLQPQSNGAQLLLDLLEKFDVMHVEKAWQECRMIELGLIETSNEIQKEDMGGQAKCSRVGNLVVAPERATHDIVKVKLKLEFLDLEI